MSTLLVGATLVEFEPARVEVGDLRVDGGRIVARGPKLEPLEGEEVVPLSGKVIIPGLVSAHHALCRTLGRGMPALHKPPEQFLELQQATWWKLDRALDADAVQLSATMGALEALGSGTTTLVDQHASPSAVSGSLLRVARGMNEVGIRGVLSYEISDRNGAVGREEALEENVAFARKAQGRFRGMVGAQASFTLSRDALVGIKQALESLGVGLHLSLAEDPADERISFQQYGEVPVARLMELSLLSPKSVVAHAVHLSWPELAQLISTGSWIVHNARSNMSSQVGYAPAGKFGARATLGTDGLSPDLFAEVQLAYLRSRDAGQAIDPLHYLANGHRLASDCFGMPIGPLQEGAAADLVVLDYRSPTPLMAENLAAHVVHGFSARSVEAVMVDGVWRLWGRRALSVNPDVVAEHAREVAHALWSRMEQL